MSYITAIATANPVNRIPQPVIAEFMLKAMQFQNGESKKLRTIFRASGIEYRHSVLSDYGKASQFDFFPEEQTAEYPSTSERLNVFKQKALPLSVEASEKILNRKVSPFAITHLVVVSCTGMYAPGLDIDLVQALKLRSDVHRTAINFMGCYAAFNALKIADAFCKADTNAKVLIVCTELCSLHFQREASDDNLLANALFADGCAAVLVEGSTSQQLQIELKAFHNDLAFEGTRDMAWNVGNLGFEMRLSAYVPDIIKSGIARLTTNLFKKISKDANQVQHYAIHPGGKKILQVIEEELGISKEKNFAAYHVLQNFGNMSSATVLFVLQELVKTLSTANVGENILSFAFGPGLTMESMVLEIKSV